LESFKNYFEKLSKAENPFSNIAWRLVNFLEAFPKLPKSFCNPRDTFFDFSKTGFGPRSRFSGTEKVWQGISLRNWNAKAVNQTFAKKVKTMQRKKNYDR
jgi:hypothetical protein